MSTIPAGHKAVMVTTKYRGVFAGLVPDDADLAQPTLSLKSARMAIHFGTSKGIQELADTGPTGNSKISAPSDIPVLHDVTAVFAVTDAAWTRWEAA